jgi:hypothetical protein
VCCEPPQSTCDLLDRHALRAVQATNLGPVLQRTTTLSVRQKEQSRSGTCRVILIPLLTDPPREHEKQSGDNVLHLAVPFVVSGSAFRARRQYAVRSAAVGPTGFATAHSVMHHLRMLPEDVDPPGAPACSSGSRRLRPSPSDLVEGALARIEQVRERPLHPPGNEWNFALVLLFALGATDQLDESAAERFEARIQDEARRLHGADE